MADKTIIFYTANRESRPLARLVQETLLEAACGLPVISVSQKPIDFGQNICVGDVGFSGHNSVRQVLIGCMEAKTRYIALAEADCLYPKEHFEYVPASDRIFWYDRNVWILNEYGFRECRKTSIAGIIVGRKKIIRSINKSLANRELWYREDTRKNLPKAYKKHGWHSCWTENPIVMIDHKNGLHERHEMSTGENKYFREISTGIVDELYPWGKAEDIWDKVKE